MLSIDPSVSIIILLSGMATAWFIYEMSVKKILEERCLLATYKCIAISYWHYGNSLLFTIEPGGYYCWYDGNDIYLYNSVTNTNTCPMSIDGSESFVSAYKIQKTPFIFSSSATNQTVCVEPPTSIIRYYENMGSQKKILRKNIPDVYDQKIGKGRHRFSAFNVYDAINLFVEEKIIKI